MKCTGSGMKKLIYCKELFHKFGEYDAKKNSG
jgi:hypothetical protein